MPPDVVRVTREQVAAARLRVVLDRRLERETPPHIYRIATAAGSSPWAPPKVVPVRVVERRQRRDDRILTAAWVSLIVLLLLHAVAHLLVALATVGVLR